MPRAVAAAATAGVGTTSGTGDTSGTQTSTDTTTSTGTATGTTSATDTTTASTTGTATATAGPSDTATVTPAPSDPVVTTPTPTPTPTSPGPTPTTTAAPTSTAPAYRVTLTAPTTVHAAKGYAVSGTAAPRTSDGPRSVAVDEWWSGRWHQVAYVKTSPTTSGVTYRVNLPARTTLATATISTRFTIGGVLYRSAVRKVTVTAALDASVSGPLSRASVPYSYRPGCPVTPYSLRRVTLTYLDYTGHYRRGSLILNRSAVSAMTTVFGQALKQRFPFKKLVPVDAYYRSGRATPTQSDVAQMNDGDTMAFNCRPVTGNPYRISQHSYGNAIDINCYENPYVTSSRVYPATAGRYLTRWPYRTGMILRGGSVASSMASLRWLWGARWAQPDYQHFSSNGG